MNRVMQIGALAFSKLQRSGGVVTLQIPVRNSLHIVAEREGEGVTKFTIHMPVEDATLLEQYAAVENASEEQKHEAHPNRESTVKWSRKELSETFLRAQVGDLRKRLEEQIREIGPMPAADNKKAVSEYARRVQAWRSQKLNRG
jgi:hypothetical protein